MRTILFVGAVLSAIFLVPLVYAQSSSPLAAFTPFVINIQQAVPVIVSVPLTITDGESLTTTIPLTVNVDLRVRVDGPAQAVVEPASTPEPMVVVATVTPAPAPDEPIFYNVVWTVASVEDVGQTWQYNDNLVFNTKGKFLLLNLDLENIGKSPVDIEYGYPYDLDIVLVDDQDRVFAIYDSGYQLNEMCQYVDINPSLSTTCFIPFEVAEDATGFTLRFTLEREEETRTAEISLKTR